MIVIFQYLSIILLIFLPMPHYLRESYLASSMLYSLVCSNSMKSLIQYYYDQ
uniref:Uncharacterized protein n=1 Tax=Anguilla anguilla TaxID=7936 RepID=A0A0E9V9E9_ANGAN